MASCHAKKLHLNNLKMTKEVDLKLTAHGNGQFTADLENVFKLFCDQTIATVVISGKENLISLPWRTFFVKENLMSNLARNILANNANSFFRTFKICSPILHQVRDARFVVRFTSL